MARETFPNSEDAVNNDRVDAFSDLQLRIDQHCLRRTESMEGTYFDFCWVIVNRTIGNTNESGLLDNLDQSRTDDKRLGCRDHAQEVPSRGETDGLLQTTRTDVSDRRSAGIGEE